jgi:Tfp pilus assembly protein PilX
MATLCRKPSKQRRRGSVLIVILVCFIIAAAMFVMLGRQAVAQRNAAEGHLWTAQAQWIAEAAVERAAARLRADAKYPGETWTITAAEIGGKQDAKARIHVEPLAGRPDSRLVRVEADYPDQPVHRARCTKRITIDLKKPTTNEAVKKP